MIEVQHLTRYYGDHPAVVDATFSIADKEIVGFLGLNGAGKSTVLRILAGLLLPSDGEVRIAGVNALDAPDSLRKRIGFLPEEPPLYRDMRVCDFLVFCGELKGMTRAAATARLADVYRLCDLEDRAEWLIEELSHGFRKRVGIAQAIIHSPDLVILDEPISGLDPAQIVEMRKVIRGLKEHCTVLLSSHILSEISQTCDRILVLHEGRLVAQGTEDELSDRAQGGNRLRLTLHGDVASVEAAMAGFEAATAVDVAETGDRINVTCTLPHAERGALVAHLVHADLGVWEVSSAEAELEQIFLGLTRGSAA